MKCVKCQTDIKIGQGYYNYPSGAMCSTCGSKRAPMVEKALNAELNKMANEIKKYGRIIPIVSKK